MPKRPPGKGFTYVAILLSESSTHCFYWNLLFQQSAGRLTPCCRKGKVLVLRFVNKSRLDRPFFGSASVISEPSGSAAGSRQPGTWHAAPLDAPRSTIREQDAAIPETPNSRGALADGDGDAAGQTRRKPSLNVATAAAGNSSSGVWIAAACGAFSGLLGTRTG
jgi:hypothetical protein